MTKKARYTFHTGYELEDDTYRQGVTIYNQNNKILFTDTSIIRKEGLGKFEKSLIALDTGLKQFRSLVSNGELEEEIPVNIIVTTKTIYNWIKVGECPKRYIDIFSSILFELSFLRNEASIIMRENERVKYRVEEQYENVTELYS